MLDWFKRKKPKPARNLDHPRDLVTGDMITLKERSIVPDELQGATLTVEKVQAYQYSDGLAPEFVLRLPTGQTYTAMCVDEEDGELMVLSKELTRKDVATLFDAEEFGGLFGESFPEVHVNKDAVKAELRAWVGDSYFQSIKEAGAYFYNEDRRAVGASSYADDGGEELRFHECDGSPDQFSLNVEIWEDGETDVFAQISLPLNVIEAMWPNGA